MPHAPRLAALLLSALITIAGQAALASTNQASEDAGVSDGFVRLSNDFIVNRDYIIGQEAGPYAGKPVYGLVDVLVIFVYFPDVSPSRSASEILSDLYVVSDYFVEASGGRLRVEWTSTAYWLQLPYTMSYYGAPGYDSPDANWYDLIVHSIYAIDPYVDLGRWRYILIVHAGDDEAMTGDPYDIWSFAVYDLALWTDEGFARFSVAVVAETDPVGVIAHELGHNVMFWPDLYDYNYEEEYVGRWGLMGGGSWNGWPPGSSPAHPMAWSKIKAGWITPGEVGIVLPGEAKAFMLTPHEVPGAVRAVKIPINPLDPYRYFLVEARAQWGSDAWLPGSGVLVTYVDETLGSGRGIVRVIDSTPGDGNVDNGQWLPGQVYRNSSLDLDVAVISSLDWGYVIAVRYSVEPVLSLSPGYAPAGASVLVSGSGFTPLSTVLVYLDYSLAAVARVDEEGGFSVEIPVPRDAPLGVHYVTAEDEYGVAATGYLQVTQASVTAAYNESTGLLSIEAWGLGPRLPYAVAVDGAVVYVAASTDSGGLALNLTLPPLRPGAHIVSLVYLGSVEGPRNWSTARQAVVAYDVFAVENGIVTKDYLDSRLSAINETLTSLADRVAGLEAELQGLEDNVYMLSLTLNATLERIDALEAGLADVNLTLVDLASRLEALNASLTAALRGLEDLSLRVEALEEDITVIEELAFNISLEVGALEERLRTLEAGLNATFEVLDERLTEAETVIEALRMNVTALRVSLQALKTTVEVVSASLNKTIERLSGMLEMLDSRVALLEAGLREVNGTVESLKPLPAQVKGLGEDLARLDAAVKRLSSNATALKERLDMLAYKLTLLEQEIAAAESSLDDSQSRLASLEAKVDILMDLTGVVDEVKALKSRVDSLEADLQEAKSQASEARQATVTYTLAGALAAFAAAVLASRLLAGR